MYIMITTISTHLIVSIYQRILGKTSTSIFNIVDNVKNKNKKCFPSTKSWY